MLSQHKVTRQQDMRGIEGAHACHVCMIPQHIGDTGIQEGLLGIKVVWHNRALTRPCLPLQIRSLLFHITIAQVFPFLHGIMDSLLVQVKVELKANHDKYEAVLTPLLSLQHTCHSSKSISAKS